MRRLAIENMRPRYRAPTIMTYAQDAIISTSCESAATIPGMTRAPQTSPNYMILIIVENYYNNPACHFRHELYLILSR